MARGKKWLPRSVDPCEECATLSCSQLVPSTLLASSCLALHFVTRDGGLRGVVPLSRGLAPPGIRTPRSAPLALLRALLRAQVLRRECSEGGDLRHQKVRGTNACYSASK